MDHLGGSLATAGLSVAIVEREAVFRDRVRGEGIHPWGMAEAARLGLIPQLLAAGANELPVWQEYDHGVPGASYRWSDDSIDGWSEYGVSHPALQQTLIEWADSCGATVFRPATAVRYASGPTLVIQTVVDERTLNARLVVGADGRRSRVGRWIGAALIQDPVHHRFGGALFDHVDLDSSVVHDARFAGGRVFILPQGNSRARVYLMLSDERLTETGAAHTFAEFVDWTAPLRPNHGQSQLSFLKEKETSAFSNSIGGR